MSGKSLVVREKSRFEGHLSSLNFGVNLFSTKSLSLTLPDEASFLELDEGRSFEFGINAFQINMPLVSRHLGFVTGIGTNGITSVLKIAIQNSIILSLY